MQINMAQIETTFDASLGIFYKTYRGVISIEDIVLSWETIFKDDLIPKQVTGFILDYRAGHFNIKIDEHVQISDFYKCHLDVFGGKKIAIITDNPKDVVIPVLVRMNDAGYESKPFCSLEASVDWVLST
jgi:hypothetical protein